MALATYDAQLAIKQEEARLEKLRGPTQKIETYTGPKIKFEETGLYKNMVKAGEIEAELTQIRNLIRKRTDPNYEPDDDDFNVKPVREFDKKLDYYKLLDIDDFASMKDIKGAYKKLVLQYHPDKNRDKKPQQIRQMQEEFEKIQEAYEILSDRATRRQYDRSKFDEARAKGQGLGGIWKEKDGSGEKDNFWSAWSAKKDAPVNKDGTQKKPKKLPKAADLNFEVKISLNKALRGGLKILEVDRARMQRSFGQARETIKTFHVPVAQGQPNGSEMRIEGEGNWPDLMHQPGDLVVRFTHKPHPYLKQIPPEHEGNVGLAKPLIVRAKVSDRVLAAWTFTFKGHMVLLRFLNPLAALAPSKACIINFVVPREGLPILGDAGTRGCLIVSLKIELDGDGYNASLGQISSRDGLRRRQARMFNHKPTVQVDLNSYSSSNLPVRKFAANDGMVDGREMHLPSVVFLWEAPLDQDNVAFAKAASGLGSMAKRCPPQFMWGYHAGWAQRRLPEPVHTRLRDDELASDDEAGVSEEPVIAKRKRVKRKYSEKALFLMKFDLVPKEGLQDPGSTDEEDEDVKAKKHITLDVKPLPSKRATLRSVWNQPRTLKSGEAAIELEEEEQEGEEEIELTKLIRKYQEDITRIEQKFSKRKEQSQLSRNEDEGLLRDLLEKDKKREMERIEKEMSGLRSQFEFQVKAEQKWMTELETESQWDNQWVCVFKPAMVARKAPQKDAPVMKPIAFNDVIKVRAKPTDDHWVQLADCEYWCLVWLEEKGKLLEKWFGPHQQKYLELQKKIDERRQTRNDTFLTYRRKKKEVTDWSIPPGPSEEEMREIEDESGEQLHELLEPILRELKDSKKRLKELRQKRLESMADRAQKANGGIAAEPEKRLPRGFRLEESSPATPSMSSTATPQASNTQVQQSEWEKKKSAADKAFGQKDWNTAISLYTEALDMAGSDLPSKTAAIIFTNRSLVHSKIDDWQMSLQDAMEATSRDPLWAKGWIRRVTAELRIQQPQQAVASLKRGLPSAEKLIAQFLPLITECEAALYNDPDLAKGEAPISAEARIEKFRTDGSTAFEQGKFTVAVFFYTRSLYHRSMMDPFYESQVLSNRAAAFLKLDLGNEALNDALASAAKHDKWAKPLIRAGQAALLLQDFKTAYTHFAHARRIEQVNPGACEGVNDCLQRIVAWDYPAAMRRWDRFTLDRRRPRNRVRVWALSDVYFEEQGAPEWCKSLSSSFFRDDVLMLAGNVAGSLAKLKFGLTVLKSKFRRVFYVPGNQDLWIRRQSLMDVLKGQDKITDEIKLFGDSVAKLLEVLQLCDELGVETAPAEVAEGVFVVPLFSWYSRDFVDRNARRDHASQSDADAKVTIDQYITWPFGCGSDDAYKFFMRMNEAPLRATLVAKRAYEQFSDKPASILSMTHFLPRPDLKFDWTVPGIWDHIGCTGLDDQIRAVGSSVHVYGRACRGGPAEMFEGVHYVHQYLGKPDQHREGFAPLCIFAENIVMPPVQPKQSH